MAILTALNTNTIQNLQLDAGILVSGATTIENFNGDLSSIGSPEILGATKGGVQFSAIPEIRNILDGIDYCRGNYKDGNVIDSWDITLKATVSEATKHNLTMAMGQMRGDGTPVGDAGNYNKLTPKMDIPTSSYLNNICWIGSTDRGQKAIIIELKNVMNMNGLNFTAEDKNTGTFELELKAHFDLAHPQDVPFVIYHPTGQLPSRQTEQKELKLNKDK